ncbi:uroporphyrinogen-III C-methyltransferase [Shewanella sp. OPT22]|nr:uroporphyrinogen-III C-methyltransferase [Shewanella sp. OPT22]
MELVPLTDNGAKGKVYIVGAGPGDPDLLTLKAWRLIKQADVVLYDALVSDEIMELVNCNCEVIAVGKRSGKHSAAQEDINQLLITKAFHHKKVVRLKGGDPYIFGRGGEEVSTLVAAEIDFEVVPAVTAAAGASAYAGIPLTHRELAQSVTFITGHCKAGAGEKVKWQEYAQSNHTLAIYMGKSQASNIEAGLIEGGRLPETPVALVYSATTTKQKVVIGTLEKLSELIAETDIADPAMMIIGEVASLHQDLNWFLPQQRQSPQDIQHTSQEMTTAFNGDKLEQML